MKFPVCVCKHSLVHFIKCRPLFAHPLNTMKRTITMESFKVYYLVSHYLVKTVLFTGTFVISLFPFIIPPLPSHFKIQRNPSNDALSDDLLRWLWCWNDVPLSFILSLSIRFLCLLICLLEKIIEGERCPCWTLVLRSNLFSPETDFIYAIELSLSNVELHLVQFDKH